MFDVEDQITKKDSGNLKKLVSSRKPKNSTNYFFKARKMDLPIYVFGPETHMTAIVGAALKVTPLPEIIPMPQTTGQFLLTSGKSVRSRI